MLPKNISLIFFIVFLAGSCREPAVPKPRDFIRVTYPEKKYRAFDTSAPYSFIYPEYANMVPDSSPGAEPYWYNLEFPSLKGTIYLSYKKINGNPGAFIEDSRKLVYKHTIKAEAIDETLINEPSKKVYGILYDLKGNTASSVQFFVTDSSRHFLRGSLYFNAQPDKDSLAPVVRFVRQDILVLLESLEWKKPQ